jgi:hypothetical protein
LWNKTKGLFKGFDNDEELAINDLLLRNQLTPQKIKKEKSLSHILLEIVKGKLKELDNWRDKENTRAIIWVFIRDSCGQNFQKAMRPQQSSNMQRRYMSMCIALILRRNDATSKLFG